MQKDIIQQQSCCWYHKGTNFQANHNAFLSAAIPALVVADTTKVRIFKQITTRRKPLIIAIWLLLIPQRYEFSSKSQLFFVSKGVDLCCCWYHKGTNFQANHNTFFQYWSNSVVVADTTKVRIFKQITTRFCVGVIAPQLLLIPQRYEFSSKSQQILFSLTIASSCCWYHKGTNFQANHNRT